MTNPIQVRSILVISILLSSLSSFALMLECFENEKDDKAKIISITTVDQSFYLLTFSQNSRVPNAINGWGYNFEFLKQSDSSWYNWPLGVYSGIWDTKSAVLVIETIGEWNIQNYNYQAKGTYFTSNLNESILIPVYCRYKYPLSTND